MDPVTITLLAQLIPSLAKMGTGIFQMARGGKYGQTPQPAYEIPESLKQSLGIAKAEAGRTTLPGQERYEEQITGRTAEAMGQAKEMADSPSAVLGSLAGLYTGSNDQLKDLTISAANYRAQQQKNLQTQLGTMAQQELSKWEWEKAKPYMQSMAASSALKGSGMQNIMTGLGNAGYGVGMVELLKAFDKKDSKEDNLTNILRLLGNQTQTSFLNLEKQNPIPTELNWEKQNPPVQDDYDYNRESIIKNMWKIPYTQGI